MSATIPRIPTNDEIASDRDSAALARRWSDHDRAKTAPKEKR